MGKKPTEKAETNKMTEEEAAKAKEAMAAAKKAEPKFEPTPQQVNIIARAVHEQMRAWCELNGQVGSPWEQATSHDHDSSREAVRSYFKDGPKSGPEEHERWMAAKEADGWKFGPRKDAKAKTHPDMVPWEKLSEFNKIKDEVVQLTCLNFDAWLCRKRSSEG